jgi:hypothetical protein
VRTGLSDGTDDGAADGVDTRDDGADTDDAADTDGADTDDAADTDGADTDDAADTDAADTVDTADTAKPLECGDCDDGLACTNDVCGLDGVCQHNVKSGFCTVAGRCVEAGDGPEPCRICVPQVRTDGLTSLSGGPCDDGNPCTTDEQCQLGSCKGGVEKVCAASSPCHESLGCQKEAGGCVEEALVDGTPCGSGLVCEDVQCLVGDGMPRGTIAWFDARRCPDGWETHSAAVGRTLVPFGAEALAAALGEGGAGIEGGEVLASGADPKHQHTASSTVTIGAESFVGIAGCCNGLAAAGTVAIAGTSSDASLGLPYLQLLACKKVSDPLGRPPRGVFAFAEGSCAEGWSASAEGERRLVVGAPEGAASGATFGGAAGMFEGRHDHAVAGAFALASHGIALASGCCAGGFASARAAQVALVTSAPTSSVVFPWRGELQCRLGAEAVSESTAEAAPPGIVLFSSEATCPEGLVPFEAGRGRLVVGSAGGDVGVAVGVPLGDREDRVHRHEVPLALTLAGKSVSAADGGNDSGAAAGQQTSTLRTEAASSGLPFRQLLMCKKP